MLSRPTKGAVGRREQREVIGLKASPSDGSGGMSLGNMLDERDRLRVLINLLENDESSSSVSLEASRNHLVRVEQSIKDLRAGRASLRRE
jgi:hypothetical protein